MFLGCFAPPPAVPGGEQRLSRLLELVSSISTPISSHLSLSLMPCFFSLLYLQGGKFCIHFFQPPLVWLRPSHPILLSRGFATRRIPAGCCLGGQGLQLDRPPCCSLGNRFPKTWKVEGWKGSREVVGRASCWGTLRQNPGEPPPAWCRSGLGNRCAERGLSKAAAPLTEGRRWSYQAVEKGCLPRQNPEGCGPEEVFVVGFQPSGLRNQ